ncbi:MAG TPA: NAD-dependent epimerase/dehydratase family protein [Polyangiaceae bacterium]
MTSPPAAAAYRGKRVVLTGAGGYIGTVILSLLRDVDCAVRAVVPPSKLQDARAALPGLGPSGMEVVGCDIRAERDFRALLGECDIVIHLAAQTSHYEANAHPTDDFGINVAPMLRLLESCREHGAAPQIVFASSATVVGLPQALPVDEQARCVPITIYDVHKLCVEEYLRFFAREHGIPSCSLRLANVYGSSSVSAKPDRGVVNLMVKRALSGEDLTVFGSGDWLRDYVHLDDVADAFLRAGVIPREIADGRAFNVCTGIGTRFRDVLRLIADEAKKLTGRESRIVHVEKVLSAIDERSYVGNHDAFTRVSGFCPRVDLRSGVLELLQSTLR